MGQFRNKPLGVLDRIYGFLSGKTQVSNAQLETPLTLVHDVSREAELGGGIGQNGGFLMGQVYVAVPGLNVYRGTADPYGGLSNPTFLGPHNSADYDIWWMGHAGMWVPSAGSGDIVGAGLAFAFIVNSMPFIETNPTYVPIFRAATDQATVTDIAGTGSIYASMPDTDRRLPTVPLYLPPGTLVTYHLSTGAAIASPGSVFWWLLWAGKKGTTPPGMR